MESTGADEYRAPEVQHRGRRRRRQVSRKRRWVSRVITALVSVVVMGVMLIGGSLVWVSSAASGHRFSIAQAPSAPVVIVLGAGLASDGTPSPYLTRRLDAARQLYNNGTVASILLTGDSTSIGHDEVGSMQTWLVDKGVPASALILDGEGIDTLASCVRARDQFGIDRAIVVTQDYHLPRALFLCQHAGLDVDGVAVSSQGQQTQRFRAREVPAVVKAAIEVLLGRAN